MTDPTDGGTVRYHRADWVPERDRWVVTFPGGRVQGFTAEQGEAMGLTSPKPEAAPLVVTCNGHSIELSDEEAEWYSTDWRGTVDHSPHGSCATKLAGLLRDARQDPQPASTVEIGGQVMTQAQYDAARFPLLHSDPQPASDPADDDPNGLITALEEAAARQSAVEPDTSDTLDFDAMPIGTVLRCTWNDEAIRIKIDGGVWSHNGVNPSADLIPANWEVVYQPAPVSPYEGLRAVLAGPDFERMLREAKGLNPAGPSSWACLMRAVGDAARSGGAT